MTWRHDVTASHKWKINNISELSDLKIYGNKKRIHFLAHLEAEIGKSGFVTSWDDVMTWRHDVTASYKCEINNIFELCDSKNHRNKKRIIFLSHLEAEICIVSSLTSWRHVEMLWRHMTWHLDDSIQLIVFKDDCSIISENFTNISLIGKKVTAILVFGSFPPPLYRAIT